MQRTERLNAILEQVGVSGRVDVGGLAAQLGVSGATVRRDLQALSRNQLLVRTHGGAVSQQSDAEVPAGVKAVLSLLDLCPPAVSPPLQPTVPQEEGAFREFIAQHVDDLLHPTKG